MFISFDPKKPINSDTDAKKSTDFDPKKPIDSDTDAKKSTNTDSKKPPRDLKKPRDPNSPLSSIDTDAKKSTNTDPKKPDKRPPPRLDSYHASIILGVAVFHSFFAGIFFKGWSFPEYHYLKIVLCLFPIMLILSLLIWIHTFYYAEDDEHDPSWDW